MSTLLIYGATFGGGFALSIAGSVTADLPAGQWRAMSLPRHTAQFATQGTAVFRLAL